MMKRNVGSVKRLLAVFLAMCMLIAAAPTSAEGEIEYIQTTNGGDAPTGTVATTPAENKFTVEGKGFVLLDTFDNDESTYYVTTTDAYGDMNLLNSKDAVPSGKQINYDAYKSNAFLNGDFLTRGNNFDSLGNNNAEMYKLPKGIIDNIDTNHVWGRFVNPTKLESGPGKGVSSTYNTGVSLLSWTDFTTYKGKLGALEVFRDANVNDTAAFYFLRDTNTWGDDSGVVVYRKENQCKFEGDGYGLLRPAFYLKKNFFKTTRIDLATMGGAVKTAIRAACTDEELLSLYGAADCETYFDMENIITVTTSVRSGAALEDVKLLDTLVASVSGGAVTGYKWQTKTGSGASWTDIDGAVSAEYIVSAAQAGAQVRCVVMLDSGVGYGEAVQVPNYEATATNVNIPDGTGTVDTTPAENKFTVEGKGFVLLDSFDNDESTYYVTTTEAYGDMETIADGTAGGFENPTGKQINYDASKSGAFLNGSFLTNGNNYTVLSDGTTTYYKLPQGIIDNINTNHVWWRFVNDYRKENGVSPTYKAGVSLLSWTDFTKYAGKFGITEVLNNANLQFNGIEKAYYLRDTHTWGGDSAVAVFRGGNAPSFVGVNAQRAGLLRPAFYLKKNFFKTTKIDLATMGGTVKTAIRAACTDEELLELYGAADCETYFGMENPIKIVTTVRSGAALADVKLLDTLIASAIEGTATDYKWQTRTGSGASWTDIDGAVSAEYIVSAAQAGAQVRCMATQEGTVIYGEAVQIPNYEATATADGGAAPAGTAETTPTDYKFTVDGKGFVLLDTFDNDESTYYVTTTDSYGDLSLLSDGDLEHPTEKQISYDSYKSNGFLNGNFLTAGNNYAALGKEGQTYYKLPKEIIDNINTNHVWWRYVNDYRKQNGVLSTYKTGISLLSWTDFTKYAGKFGAQDVFNDINVNSAAANVYFLRDTNAWGGDSALALYGGTKYGGKCVFKGQYVEAAGLLRPAFYLKKNFFKTIRIDLATMGDAVKTAIRAACTDEELISLYGIKDCIEYFGMEIDTAYIELSTRSGKSIENAELLDTVVATAENGTVGEFSWEISDDGGNSWHKVEKATGDSFILTAEYAGKMLRCTAVSNGTEISSRKLNVPKPVIKTPERVNLDTFAERTPDKYRFTVDGKGFVLLDSFDNDESTYYVTTTDAYGDMKLLTDGDIENPTGKQINYDACKSDAFLNGDFLTKGNNYSNLGNNTETYYKLPQGIIDNINTNHIWWRFVNDYRKENGVADTYKTGVSFLSWTDFTAYAGKFGLVDVFYDANVKNANVYFLRDTNNWGGDSALTVFGTGEHENKCIFIGQYVETAGLLRPAFYLKKDFFQNVKLDLAQTGDAVLNVMRGRYAIEDLTDIYPEQELEERGFSHRYSMQATYTLYNGTQELESLVGAASLQANVTIRNRGNSDTQATLLMGLYNENGKRIKLVKKPVTLKAGRDTESVIAIPELPAGVTSDYRISLMLWDSVKGMESLAGSKLTFGDKGNINGNTLKIESDAVGNIFTDAEDAKIKINSSANNISYRITDYDNNLVKTGTVNTNNNFAELDLNGLDVGYYEIAVQNGGIFDENAKKKLTAVAIIPEFDFSGVSNSPFGTNTHFELNWLGWSIDTIPLLQKAGVKSVRDGYEWYSMESEVKGEYKNYNFFPFEQARLREAGIDYLYVAGSHNKFYDNGASPYTDEGIQGLANYAKKATELYNYYYGDYKLKFMEMYNEWYTAAGDKGDGPADSSPENYIKVFQKMYETVKTAYPDMTMFLNIYPEEENSEGLLGLGGLAHCDGYALHHYNYSLKKEDPENPECGLGITIDKTRDMITKYNTENKALKFWLSEFGWPSVSASDWGVLITEKEQAEYLVRGYATALSKGMERVYWYDFMNDRDREHVYEDDCESHKKNGEYNYGLIRNGFDQTYGAHTPKRAYVAYANLTRELANKTFVNLDKADDGVGAVYHYHFDGSGGKTAIAYYAVLDGNEEKPVKNVTITANESVVVKNIEGKIIETASAGNDITLNLSSSPVYIEGGYTVKQ